MDFDQRHYTVRRKVLKIFGASFHILDPNKRVLGFSSQKAFRLKEDIRVFSDESKSNEILAIRARQVIDFAAAYDVVDSAEGRKVGAARRKGWSSIVRDEWKLLDENEAEIATVKEDSATMALLRRFLSNLIPQRFLVRSADGRAQATFRVRFNPFVYKLDVEVAPDCTLDPRLILAAAILLAAIEGRQQ